MSVCSLFVLGRSVPCGTDAGTGDAPNLYTLDSRPGTVKSESTSDVNHPFRSNQRARPRPCLGGYHLEFCVMAGYVLDGSWTASRSVIELVLPVMLTEAGMTGMLWLALPDTPDKDIGLSYFGVVSSLPQRSNKIDGRSSSRWASSCCHTRRWCKRAALPFSPAVCRPVTHRLSSRTNTCLSKVSLPAC